MASGIGGGGVPGSRIPLAGSLLDAFADDVDVLVAGAGGR